MSGNRRTFPGGAFGVPRGDNNKYVSGCVGGGGPWPPDPFRKWRNGETSFQYAFRQWWTGADVRIIGPGWAFGFNFPEGRVVDDLAWAIAHVLDWLWFEFKGGK